MLWLAIHLPLLPLEIFPPRHHGSPTEPDLIRPRLVVIAQGSGERVMLADALASGLGIRPGMKLSAAFALANELDIFVRKPEAETQQMSVLAAWALQFTPTVVIGTANTLLLDIGGSLRYFGGLLRLRELVSQGLAGFGLTVTTGVAPTPLAAGWRAACNRPRAVLQDKDIGWALAELPLAVLPVPDATLDGLSQLGLNTLADVMALPRAGLKRRFGQALPLLLDQATGEAADPREPYTPPDRFEYAVDLDYPVDHLDTFAMVGQWLFDALETFLSGRGLGVQEVTLRLKHEDIEPTALVVRFGVPGRRAAQFMSVLQERLERYELAAPAFTVTLIAEQLHQLDGMPLGLFGHEAGDANFQLLLARLSARLGEDAVRAVATVADHRPELAWRVARPGEASTPLPVGERPGWLLATPMRLSVRDERPWYGETLTPEGWPERIESGWWDENPIARDYYTARGTSGRRYWIWYDHTQHDWWLHGIF
ncbi:Y-family DNA polymerase [Silvimonas iriomotensis]|uniref:DNA polymerase n=1 Tax=Silvimonas iriomotensis TaxID=449662 RepID=A0ABQ2P535_9NEIS|nr:DNA polymerase Y family protein [Silvimonas iriomotensis]GGP18300.1 DNA polymerase [Silvimonas iriomotensis]